MFKNNAILGHILFQYILKKKKHKYSQFVDKKNFTFIYKKKVILIGKKLLRVLRSEYVIVAKICSSGV